MLKTLWKILLLAVVAEAGAALGDLIYQRMTGERGRVLLKTKSGDWTINVPPQVLVPAIAAGFRAEERGLLRSFTAAAFMTGTGGKQLGGIAQMLRNRMNPASQ